MPGDPLEGLSVALGVRNGVPSCSWGQFGTLRINFGLLWSLHGHFGMDGIIEITLVLIVFSHLGMLGEDWWPSRLLGCYQGCFGCTHVLNVVLNALGGIL